jgi:hypothetical protein
MPDQPADRGVGFRIAMIVTIVVVGGGAIALVAWAVMKVM